MFLVKIKYQKGSGTFGKVYVVESPENEIMAMKVIDLGPESSEDYAKIVKSVQQEFLIGKKLGSKSPFLVKMFKSIIDKNFCYLIMEYCDCGDVSELIEKNGKLPASVCFFSFSVI
jgi:serine/threonine protein kinase